MSNEEIRGKLIQAGKNGFWLWLLFSADGIDLLHIESHKLKDSIQDIINKMHET